MYHIKNDQRCRRSAQKIVGAFRKLLEEKPLSEISVSDIQRASGAGRATFYRLFDNIDDVLLYAAEEEFRYMLDLYRETSLDEFTAKFIEFVITGIHELLNIMGSGKMHVISVALRTVLADKTGGSGRGADDISAYMIAIFTGSCVSLVTAWDENGRRESIEELAGILKKALNIREMDLQIFRNGGSL